MKNEIKSLTGLRGLAAFYVMVYHYSYQYDISGITRPYIVTRGYLAVDIFYVLSGFILASIYSDSFTTVPNFANYRSFLLKRVARIYPAYFVFNLLYMARIVLLYYFKPMMAGTTGAVHIASFRDILLNFAMMHGWGMKCAPVIGDSWSISTEFLCYLLFPLLVLLCIGSRPIVGALAALLAVSTTMAVAELGHGVNGPLDVVPDGDLFPVLRTVAGFSLGLLAYRVAQGAQVRALMEKSVPFIAILAAFLLCLALGVHDVIVFLLVPALIICLYYDSRLTRVIFGNRLVHHLGEISYSLYLAHLLVAMLVERLAHVLLYRNHYDLYLATALLGMALSWLAAYLAFRFVERPGKRLILATADMIGRRGPAVAAQRALARGR